MHRLLFIGLLVSCCSALCNEPADSNLILNGKGTRNLLFIELYTCELYLDNPTSRANDILSRDQRLLIKLEVHGEPPDDVPTDWASVLQRELSDKIYDQVTRTYTTLVSGDQIELLHRPGSGTEVKVNNRVLFTDPGRSLIVAILEQWLGETPVSEDLKAALLGPIEKS